MAKITKNMLKGLVKECLVEILAEGIGGSQLNEIQQPRQTRRPKKRESLLDQMDKSFSQKTPKANFNQSVTDAARLATDDPVLQGILADTAKTTLQEQLQHEPRSSAGFDPSAGALFDDESSGPGVASPAAGIDIGSIFGDITDNWSKVLEGAEVKKLV